jgi:hypothetical protein
MGDMQDRHFASGTVTEILAVTQTVTGLACFVIRAAMGRAYKQGKAFSPATHPNPNTVGLVVRSLLIMSYGLWNDDGDVAEGRLRPFAAKPVFGPAFTPGERGESSASCQPGSPGSCQPGGRSRVNAADIARSVMKGNKTAIPPNPA